MVDVGDPGVRRGVVGADRQQDVAGQRHRLQFREELVGGVLRLGQRGRGVHPPPGRVVRRHVVRQQTHSRRGDPFELAAELHASRIAVGCHRPPLVIRPARPRTRRQPGVGGHARKLRIMAEHVELPGRRRRSPQHVALKTNAVHKVPDRGLRPGEVGVGFVVGTAHHLDAALGDEPQQICAVFGVGVEVRLEVVDLGQHELVDRFASGHLQVRRDKSERVVLFAPPGRVLGPQAGVGALGVPPHRVVVEVADHVHRPARFGDGEVERELRRPGDHLGRAPIPRHRTLDANGHLNYTVVGDGHRVAAQSLAHHPHAVRPRGPGVAHPHHLQRCVGASYKEFGRLRRGHLHAGKSTRVTPRAGL